MQPYTAAATWGITAASRPSLCPGWDVLIRLTSACRRSVYSSSKPSRPSPPPQVELRPELSFHVFMLTLRVESRFSPEKFFPLERARDHTLADGLAFIP